MFRWTHELFFDEPEYVAVGNDEHPCPHDYLLATVGGCQLETLTQWLEKGAVDEYSIEIQVESRKGTVAVDDDMPGTADIRITDIHTDIAVEVPSEYEPRATRCLDVFEAHCPISQSVDAGVTLHTSDSLSVTDD